MNCVSAVNEYCMKNKIPNPSYEYSGDGAAGFTCKVTLKDTSALGSGRNKHDAKHKAVEELIKKLRILDAGGIPTNSELDNMVSLSSDTDNEILTNVASANKEERYRTFGAYHDLNRTKSGRVTGFSISDRHNYFQKFNPVLKQAAYKVIASTEYESKKTQALDLLAALKIKPNLTIEPSTSGRPLVSVELDCEYDVVFMGDEKEVYEHILEYFKNML